jgi:hypothetical protein
MEVDITKFRGVVSQELQLMVTSIVSHLTYFTSF